MHRPPSKEHITLAIIEQEILSNQTLLVSECLSSELFRIDDICTKESVNPFDDIREWWLVSEWLGEQLRFSHNQCVLSNEYGIWWGRQCAGQLIVMDGVIREIVTRMYTALIHHSQAKKALGE